MLEIIRYQETKSRKKIEEILQRSQLEYGDVQNQVADILLEVKIKKDAAVRAYTKKFDGAALDSLQVTQEEIDAAFQKVDCSLIEVIKRAKERIAAFHTKQKLNSWLEPAPGGETLGQLIRPLETVGVYVPGGKAAYPSSVLMNIMPAKVAGVKKIIMTTPCQPDGSISPVILVAAAIAGADEIYKVGGAQAVGALAYGTESIPKVDKIVGPGNIYVALAKRTVYGHVDIDSVAGPSEILIIADNSANPSFIAADLLSQAEHDELASSILITDDFSLAENVLAAVKEQAAVAPRKEIIEKSLAQYGAIIVVDDINQAVGLSNEIAPEHLEICTHAPFELLPEIVNAGAIFLGHYSPEPLGDYMAGPNHVLPTGRTARFFSPLSVDDFIKKSSIISFSKDALENLSGDIVTFAESEGLYAHGAAVSIRFKQ